MDLAQVLSCRYRVTVVLLASSRVMVRRFPSTDTLAFSHTTVGASSSKGFPELSRSLTWVVKSEPLLTVLDVELSFALGAVETVPMFSAALTGSR